MFVRLFAFLCLCVVQFVIDFSLIKMIKTGQTLFKVTNHKPEVFDGTELRNGGHAENSEPSPLLLKLRFVCGVGVWINRLRIIM